MKLALLTFLTLAFSSGADSGLDTYKLARIPVRMEQFVEQQQVSGVVTLVARHGQIAELDAVGYRDIEGKKLMTKSTIFQIMSMTKPVTGVGIMMLVEEGKIALKDPVEKYVPDFKGQLLATGAKPTRPITIRDLLTHTSGLPGEPPAEIKGLFQTMDHSLEEAVALYGKMPLKFEPGTRWDYSNTGIATLGRIIEVASDTPYDKFITDRILKPLGMKDTFFFPPEDKLDRIAMVYESHDGKLVRAGANILGGDPAKYRQGARYPAPEFGLYSTASDLVAFYQMMLNGGKYQGHRYLSRVSTEIMRLDHTKGIERAGWLGGTSYGLSWEVVREPFGTLMLMPEGTYGHGGAFGTQGWIDPKDDLIRVMLIQKSGNADDVKAAFLQMAAGAMID